MSRPVCAPLGNEAERLRGAIDNPPNSKSTDPHTLDAEDGKGSRCGQRSPGCAPVRHCDNETLRPISRSGQRTSGELCPVAVSRPPELAQTSRLRTAARIDTGPCSHPVDADTQEDAGANDRRSKKNQQPQCGGHAPETTPRYPITATLSRLTKFAPQDGGATKICPPPTSLAAGRLDELCSSGLTATTIGLPGRRKPDPRGNDLVLGHRIEGRS